MITSAAAAEYENLLRGNSLHIKLNDDDILHLAMCLPPLSSSLPLSPIILSYFRAPSQHELAQRFLFAAYRFAG